MMTFFLFSRERIFFKVYIIHLRKTNKIFVIHFEYKTMTTTRLHMSFNYVLILERRVHD